MISEKRRQASELAATTAFWVGVVLVIGGTMDGGRPLAFYGGIVAMVLSLLVLVQVTEDLTQP